MDEVRKLHRVLNEEDRNIVADQVPVAFIGIELDRESPHVACSVDRAALASDSGKPHEDRRALPGRLERRGLRVLRHRCVALEVPMRAGSASMDDPSRNPLMIEMRDLLTQNEI